MHGFLHIDQQFLVGFFFINGQRFWFTNFSLASTFEPSKSTLREDNLSNKILTSNRTKLTLCSTPTATGTTLCDCTQYSAIAFGRCTIAHKSCRPKRKNTRRREGRARQLRLDWSHKTSLKFPSIIRRSLTCWRVCWMATWTPRRTRTSWEICTAFTPTLPSHWIG